MKVQVRLFARYREAAGRGPVERGGPGDGAALYRMTEEPLSEAAVTAAVVHPEAGGVVVFSGVVRNETGGRWVKFLEYEAHAPMAEAKMREIGEMVHARWPGVKAVAMAHRVGRLEVGGGG